MSETSSQPRTLRRVGAVLAGLLLVIITSTATDTVMHATGIFPPVGWPMPDSLFVLALAYRIVYSVAGGYLTARLAPDHPVQHALWLGIIGTILGIAGTLATWNRGVEFGPKWYPLLLAATAIPSTWLGGKLVREQS